MDGRVVIAIWCDRKGAKAFEPGGTEDGGSNSGGRSKRAHSLDRVVEDKDAREVRRVFGIVDGRGFRRVEDGRQSGQVAGLGHSDGNVGVVGEKRSSVGSVSSQVGVDWKALSRNRCRRSEML